MLVFVVPPLSAEPSVDPPRAPDVIAVIPARYGSTRFPGKPLADICGRPMIEHVFERARMFSRWDVLALATCDQEIADFATSKGYPVIMTASTHTRALDRVAEAVQKCGITVDDQDIVLNVQGDEPMMNPDMIAATIRPMEEHAHVQGTMLAMDIVDEAQYENPEIGRAHV
mgnify:CR=1 FL=1